MGEIVKFSGITTLDLPADRVLEEAIGCLDQVVVVGFTKDGDEYFASSTADGGDTLWMLERAKKRLLDVVDR